MDNAIKQITDELTQIQQAPPVTHKDEKLYKTLEAMKKISNQADRLLLKVQEMMDTNEIASKKNEELLKRIEKLEKMIASEKKKKVK